MRLQDVMKSNDDKSALERPVKSVAIASKSAF